MRVADPMRSRIVLLASEGLQNKQIAEKLEVAPRMVTLWRGRFLKLGVKGLLKDAPRPGRTPSISAKVTAALIAKTTQSYAGQRHALVYANHGQGNEHFQSFGVAHLAGQRPEATSRRKLCHEKPKLRWRGPGSIRESAGIESLLFCFR
jgi:hypothetical protein